MFVQSLCLNLHYYQYKIRIKRSKRFIVYFLFYRTLGQCLKKYTREDDISCLPCYLPKHNFKFVKSEIALYLTDKGPIFFMIAMKNNWPSMVKI